MLKYWSLEEVLELRIKSVGVLFRELKCWNSSVLV